VAHKTAQQLARLRRGADLARHGARAAAVAGNAVGAGTHVAAHVVGGEFRVELQTPGVLAPAEGVAAVLRRTRQHGGAGRRLEHGLQVGGLGREAGGQAGEQRVGGGGRVQFQADGARFAPGRVVVHLPA